MSTSSSKNPNATLPTLSIDGNVYANTIDVTKYLIANAPQTPGKTSGTDFVTRIHKDNVDPNFALLAAVVYIPLSFVELARFNDVYDDDAAQRRGAFSKCKWHAICILEWS